MSYEPPLKKLRSDVGGAIPTSTQPTYPTGMQQVTPSAAQTATWQSQYENAQRNQLCIKTEGGAQGSPQLSSYPTQYIKTESGVANTTQQPSYSSQYGSLQYGSQESQPQPHQSLEPTQRQYYSSTQANSAPLTAQQYYAIGQTSAPKPQAPPVAQNGAQPHVKTEPGLAQSQTYVPSQAGLPRAQPYPLTQTATGHTYQTVKQEPYNPYNALPNVKPPLATSLAPSPTNSLQRTGRRRRKSRFDVKPPGVKTPSPAQRPQPQLNLQPPSIPPIDISAFLHEKELMQVPNSKVGVVIGKRGAKIQEIQEQTNTRLGMAKESEPGSHMRDLTIEGTRENIEKAKAMVNAAVSGIPDFAIQSGMAPDGQLMKTLDVTPVCIGIVIGRGGENIRKLKEELECSIHVESATPQADGTSKPGTHIYLKGSAEAIKVAENRIMEMIRPKTRGRGRGRGRGIGRGGFKGRGGRGLGMGQGRGAKGMGGRGRGGMGFMRMRGRGFFSYGRGFGFGRGFGYGRALGRGMRGIRGIRGTPRGMPEMRGRGIRGMRGTF